MAVTDERNTEVRGRIVRATAKLLADGGREAVSTRSVSAAAGVQAPTIYRQFGDMRGLLDAVARETLAEYVRRKAAPEPTADPIADLRRGWNLHVAFGLANPAVYPLLFADPSAAVAAASAASDAAGILDRLLTRAAEAGRLRVSVPHAARLLSAAGSGVTLSLIAAPPEARDPRLADAMREAVFAAITVRPDAPAALADAAGPRRVAARAVALHAVLAEAPRVLTAAERRLLGEWLDRLAAASG